MPLVKPAGYRNLLDNVENTEKAIKLVKDMFQQNLSAQLALLRVTAPMVVLSGTGINDDLNSVERPVSFPIRDMDERRAGACGCGFFHANGDRALFWLAAFVSDNILRMRDGLVRTVGKFRDPASDIFRSPTGFDMAVRIE